VGDFGKILFYSEKGGYQAMLKMQLPLFPPELTFINKQISFQKRDGRIYYFHGLLCPSGKPA